METITIERVAELCHCTLKSAEKVVKDPTFPAPMRPTRLRIWELSRVEDWLRSTAEDAKLIGDLKGKPEQDTWQDTAMLRDLAADSEHERAAEIDIDESQFEGAETLGDLKRRQAEARG